MQIRIETGRLPRSRPRPHTGRPELIAGSSLPSRRNGVRKQSHRESSHTHAVACPRRRVRFRSGPSAKRDGKTNRIVTSVNVFGTDPSKRHVTDRFKTEYN